MFWFYFLFSLIISDINFSVLFKFPELSPVIINDKWNLEALGKLFIDTCNGLPFFISSKIFKPSFWIDFPALPFEINSKASVRGRPEESRSDKL